MNKYKFIFAYMIRSFVNIGTFLRKSAAESETDCEACYAGFYCPLWAQTSVDLLCPPGWFCPPGSSTARQSGTPHIVRDLLGWNAWSPQVLNSHSIQVSFQNEPNETILTSSRSGVGNYFA